MMPVLSMVCGLALIVVGVVGYTGQDPNPETGKVSMTALIPAFIGGLLLVLGLIAFNPGLRKHAMHFASLVGVVGAIGGFMPLIRQYNKTGALDLAKPSAVSGWLTILICAVFVGFSVKFFIQARKARKAKQAGSAV